MGRARRGFDLAADLAASAVARIDEPSLFEGLDRLAIALEPFALTNDVAVPVEPDRGQVGELPALVLDR